MRNYFVLRYSTGTSIYNMGNGWLLFEGGIGFCFINVGMKICSFINNSRNKAIFFSFSNCAGLLSFRNVFYNLIESTNLGFCVLGRLSGFGFKVTKNLECKDSGVLDFYIGYNHPINYLIPKFLYFNILNKRGSCFNIFSFNCENVFKILATLKRFKGVNVYSGSGIFFNNEEVVLKKLKSGIK